MCGEVNLVCVWCDECVSGMQYDYMVYSVGDERCVSVMAAHGTCNVICECSVCERLRVCGGYEEECEYTW